jgi:hypothetical protein
VCDLAVGKKGLPADDVYDFIYLFEYYVSDSNDLKLWRELDKPAAAAAQAVISKHHDAPCKPSAAKDNRARAGCVLRFLSRGNKIRLYGVRYDENERVVWKATIP